MANTSDLANTVLQQQNARDMPGNAPGQEVYNRLFFHQMQSASCGASSVRGPQGDGCDRAVEKTP